VDARALLNEGGMRARLDIVEEDVADRTRHFHGVIGDRTVEFTIEGAEPVDWKLVIPINLIPRAREEAVARFWTNSGNPSRNSQSECSSPKGPSESHCWGRTLSEAFCDNLPIPSATGERPMKRDDQLLYRILDILEESSETELHGSKIKEELNKAGDTLEHNLIFHHLKLLEDRACIEAVTGAFGDSINWRITDEGHNLAAKNPQRTIAGFTSLGAG
jgi:hypothetical protein